MHCVSLIYRSAVRRSTAGSIFNKIYLSYSGLSDRSSFFVGGIKFAIRKFHKTQITNSSKRDYYDVLGVKRGATDAELKKAYFAKAKQYHPDANRSDKSAADKFKEVTEAYEVLKDSGKRKAYDSYGHAGVEGGGMGGFGGGGGGGGGGTDPFAEFFRQTAGGAQRMNQEDFFSTFDQVFGGGGFQRRGGTRTGTFSFGGEEINRPTKGPDLHMAIKVPFSDIVNGAKRDISVEYTMQEPSGRARKISKRLNVTIPQGIESGTELRLSGQGGESPATGMPRGDLYLEIRIENDPYFRKEGQDVHVDINVPLTSAIIGGTIDVCTLDGIVEVKIPPGTQPGAILALRGKGLKPQTGGSRGSQFVHVNIEIPKSLSSRQKELIDEWKKLDSAHEEAIKTKATRLAREAQRRVER